MTGIVLLLIWVGGLFWFVWTCKNASDIDEEK